MTLGMVVRDDQGGLGNLTYRAWAELRPDVTLVVQWRPCRGIPNPDRFTADWTETILTDRPIDNRQWRKMATRAQTWWTAEMWYSQQAERILAEEGCRSILYAMPELYKGSEATEVWNPTDYLTDRARLDDVMRWPTFIRGDWRVRTTARRILHVSGGAIGDRNGTTVFMEALRRTEADIEVLLHQPEQRHRLSPQDLHRVADGVQIHQTDQYFPSLLSAIKWADVLVLPRRYAGLCLPALEAMADGCPVVMTDAPPQNGWPIIRCQAEAGEGIRLPGGWVPTWEADPAHLAYCLEELADEDVPTTVHRSEHVRRWSESRSWAGELGDQWRDRIACGR